MSIPICVAVVVDWVFDGLAGARSGFCSLLGEKGDGLE